MAIKTTGRTNGWFGLGWVGLIGLVGLVGLVWVGWLDGLVRGGVQQATGYFCLGKALHKKKMMWAS